MRIHYCDHFVLPLPEGHRFPLAKYALLRERVVEAGLGDSLVVPHAASDAELERVHDPGYIRRVTEGTLRAGEIRRIGFPWSAALVERARRSVGGTIEACVAASRDGAAVSLAGGTHHAFADSGEGFCVFNDVAVAARAAQARQPGTRVLVVDCDVHQGNGTAAIFRDDSSVFTFSVHARGNFPFRKEESDLGIALEDGVGDEAYLDALAGGLDLAFARSRPDLVIYVSGADPFADDRLGRLAVSKRGLEARDRQVLARCRDEGVPVAVVMGGAYARRVEDAVEIHFATLRAAAEVLPQRVRVA